MRFPNDENERQQWLAAMGWRIKAGSYGLDINADPRKHRLAYWHFKEESRECVGGSWRLKAAREDGGRGRKSVCYVDADKKNWGCIVPDSPLRSFIDE